MFDVSWTDPSRETVGERRTRKESKDQIGDNPNKETSSSSSSNSNGSHSQNRPSLFGLFETVGTITYGKKALRRSGSKSKLSRAQIEENENVKHRMSSFTIQSSASDPESVINTPALTNFFEVKPFLDRQNVDDQEDSQSTNSEVAESVFSGWTGRSANTSESIWSSVMESSPVLSRSRNSMSDSAFVKHHITTEASSRASIEAAKQVATVTSVSLPPLPVQFPGASNTTCSEKSENQALGSTYNPALSSSPLLGRDGDLEEWPVPPRTRQSGYWQLPHIGKCPNDSDSLTMTSSIMLGQPLVPVKSVRRKPVLIELTHLQRNIRRMDAASSKIVLERLKEEWLQITDASMYRELELEKQLWLLTALQHLRRGGQNINLDDMPPTDVDRSQTMSKKLSLYENHASASFLSALHPSSRLHHISMSPVSPTFFPNIHPLAVPLATTQLPYASNLFSSIHAFALSAVFPASQIPEMLRECYRTLRSSKPPSLLPFSVRPCSPESPISSASTRTVVPPRLKKRQQPGSIHLTVIDPAPIPETLGPKLRAWLDAHLILNLERNFKCINPGRLFPIWLADAGLRGEGSTIVSVHFDAIMKNEEAKVQLKTVVGRTLWKEMWGTFVEAERWWWEDEEIVKECLELETRWEWSVIKGVKEE